MQVIQYQPTNTKSYQDIISAFLISSPDWYLKEDLKKNHNELTINVIQTQNLTWKIDLMICFIFTKSLQNKYWKSEKNIGLRNENKLFLDEINGRQIGYIKGRSDKLKFESVIEVYAMFDIVYSQLNSPPNQGKKLTQLLLYYNLCISIFFWWSKPGLQS